MLEEINQKIISQREVEKELKAAEAERRDADFANKTIQEINLSEREIKCGINFKGSVFLGNVYMSKTKINGSLIFDNAIVNNTLYLGEIKITEMFSADRIAVKNSLNMVKSSVERDVSLERANIRGFLSLNNLETQGSLNLKQIKTINLETPSGTIKGDLFLQKGRIEKFVDLSGSEISGLADFEGINVWGHVNFSNSKIKEVLILKESYIEGDSIFDNLECEKRIVSI